MTLDDVYAHLKMCGDLAIDCEEGTLVFIAIAVPSLNGQIQMAHNFPTHQYRALSNFLMGEAGIFLADAQILPTERGH